MTFTPPSGPIIRAVKPLPVVETSKAVALQPRMEMLYMIPATLIFLINGIIMTTAGIALLTSDLGLILLILGVIFLAISFAARRGLADSNLLESSTVLALYVAVEFLAGAVLVFIGIGNLPSSSEGLDLSLVAVSAFGLLLVADSLLLYRRDFKQVAGKKKGV